MFFTGGLPEVGGGAAYIVDVAFELWVFGQKLRLLQQGFMAAGLNDPPLMEGQSAEAAAAKAAAAALQAEFHFLDGINTPILFVHGVILPLIRQIIYIIHFLLCQGFLRRILYHKGSLVIGLHQRFAGEGVCVAVLGIKALCVFLFVRYQSRILRQQGIVIHIIQRGGFVGRSPDESDVFYVKAAVQGIGQLHDASFSHAIHQNVRLRIQKNGAF